MTGRSSDTEDAEVIVLQPKLFSTIDTFVA